MISDVAVPSGTCDRTNVEDSPWKTHIKSQELISSDEPVSFNELETGVNVIEGKGEFLGGGATGLVERLESGNVVKSPWLGRSTESDCKQELAIEAQIYKRLGAHPRLVQFKEWDPVEYTLMLEYMPNGNLLEYMKKHGQAIKPDQRAKWAVEAAEGIELLHCHHIIQGDVGPHNFLLDVDLNLKICDFGGSSMDGSRASVAPGVRYRLPSMVAGTSSHATVKEDLFALGSTIYFIATGSEAYTELTEDDQVEQLYKEGIFPTLDGVLFAAVIAICWKQEAESATVLVELMKRSMAKV